MSGRLVGARAGDRGDDRDHGGAQTLDQADEQIAHGRPHPAPSARRPRSSTSSAAAMKSGRVQRHPGMGLERALPDRRQQHRRDQQPGAVAGIDRAELAARDPALDLGPEQAQPALDHLLMVEARELGEIARLGDHELRDRPDPGALEQRADLPDHQLDARGGRPRVRPQQALDPREVRQQRLPHHRFEELLLAGEIEVERALADAGARRDVVDPRRAEAALGEHLERRLDDLGRPRLLAPSPTPCRCHAHRVPLNN